MLRIALLVFANLQIKRFSVYAYQRIGLTTLSQTKFLVRRVLICLILLCPFTHAEQYTEQLLILPSTHLARNDILFVCQKSNQTRAVSLVYLDGPPLPCEVIYHRPSEGKPDKVLWTAANDEGFCEERTHQLIADLINGGWHCLEE